MRLGDDRGTKPQDQQGSFPTEQQGEDVQKAKSSSRGKRMIQSVTCVTGSPKRMPLEDDTDAEHEPHSRRQSSTKSKAAKEDVIHESHRKERELKVNDVKAQEQLENVLHTIISNEEKEPAVTRQYQQAVSLKIQPTFDDAVVIFQSPSSDAGTQVSQGSKDKAATSQTISSKAESKVEPSPAKPVILSDDNDGEEAIIGPPAISRSTDAAPTGTQHDSYSHVESLIARVKRLDAVVKAGEEEEVARGIVQEKEASSFDLKEKGDATVDTEDFVLDKKRDKSIDSCPNEGLPLRQQSPIDTVTRNEIMDEMETHKGDSPQFDKSSTNEPPHDSPPHRQQQKSNRSVTPSASADEKESSVDGANHFKVIYQRGDGIPRNSPLKATSVATTTTSSIVTVSSFGIPGIQSIQKTTATVTPPIHHRPLRTPHPFFWRTHPKEIFTSYASTPNRQKTLMAPLQGVKSKPLSTNRVSSHGPIKSSRQSRMRTVEESGEQKQGFRATNPYTFWSKERDPVDSETELLEDGAADFSPYGDKAASALESVPSPQSVVSSGHHTCSDSTQWVVFSEFSVSSTDEFR